MRPRRHSPRLCLAATLAFCGMLCAGEALPVPPPANHAAPHIKIGRELFAQKAYDEALKSFSAAVAMEPENREARMLAGLAAYWARKPEEALKYWNALLDSAKRNTVEEWELERHRVMALSALNQPEAAEQVVLRLYELRREVKLKEAVAASGFVREHIYLDGLRAGCWEVMDERHEAQDVWRFPVASTKTADGAVLRTLAVRAAALPGGGNGFVLSEEKPGERAVYQRWVERPAYAEVRALVRKLLEGKLDALELKEISVIPAPPKPSTGLDGKTRPETAPQRVLSAAEQELAGKIHGLRLDPAAARILLVAAGLRDVAFDVTRLTRLSLSDREMAEEYMRELSVKTPFAQEDAAELVDLISKAKAGHVAAVYANWGQLGARKPYLDFALLTAINTRGRDAPAALVSELAKSADFMVRSTAALLQARQGDAQGVERLFKDVESADAVGCAILSASIEDLIGRESLGAAPQPNASADALKAWQNKARNWWRENGGKIQYNAEPKVDTPYWRAGK